MAEEGFLRLTSLFFWGATMSFGQPFVGRIGHRCLQFLRAEVRLMHEVEHEILRDIFDGGAQDGR